MEEPCRLPSPTQAATTGMLAVFLVAIGFATQTIARDNPAGSELQGASALARQVARGTGQVLGGGGLSAPQLGMTLVSGAGDVVQLDELIAAGPAVLFYFSAGCSHCEEVAPEIGRLGQRLNADAALIAIASGSNSLSAARDFVARHQLPGSVYKDFSRQFSSRNRLQSTPSVLLTAPSPEPGGFETLAEYRPFAPGMSLLVEMRLASHLGEDPWSRVEQGQYYGPKACGACHLDEYMSWGLSHHSIAYWTLHKGQRAEDPACVGCHVTGMGEPSGFVLGDHHSPLADVGCEACHGPGGAHGGSSRDPKLSCETCHDKDHSVRFDLERALPHVDHFRPEILEPVAYRELRQALVDGRAERPLMAFPKGKHLGQGACVSCHPAASKGWRSGPHAGALKTLTKRNAQHNPECISCHDLARDSDAAERGYFGEGVSCESCHGPGEQHVAARGGTDNILGLGSSCPECIIEALCTSCHTPEQDPSWSLTGDLDRLKRWHRAPAPARRPASP